MILVKILKPINGRNEKGRKEIIFKEKMFVHYREHYLDKMQHMKQRQTPMVHTTQASLRTIYIGKYGNSLYIPHSKREGNTVMQPSSLQTLFYFQPLHQYAPHLPWS